MPLLSFRLTFLSTNTVRIISESTLPYDLKAQINDKIRSVIEKDKMAEVIRQTNIPDLTQRINATKTRINIETIKLGESGKAPKSSTELGMILGYIFGFFMYMFILFTGLW